MLCTERYIEKKKKKKKNRIDNYRVTGRPTLKVDQSQIEAQA